MDQVVTQKVTKKELQVKQRQTEDDLAKALPYEEIIERIATAKKTRTQVQSDINSLCRKRDDIDSEISKYHRILSYKKKQDGA